MFPSLQLFADGDWTESWVTRALPGGFSMWSVFQHTLDIELHAFSDFKLRGSWLEGLFVYVCVHFLHYKEEELKDN